jgi:hypothetical protein
MIKHQNSSDPCCDPPERRQPEKGGRAGIGDLPDVAYLVLLGQQRPQQRE